MPHNEIDTFCPASRLQWRQWLQENHHTRESIWLVYYKKQSGQPTVQYQEALEEALCFGWIDSTKKSLGDDRFMQFFCRRKPTSVWSKINKEKVQRLIETGYMEPAGLACIEKAKQNGSWVILDEVEELVVPKDLLTALKKIPGAKDYFLCLSNSVKKSILQWLVLAKRPETRQKRILEIAELAGVRQKPKQFR
ncbi:Uncharacterized conserved protein YdeI, YjbR/CyaY-like superfamily, DUF1801 family [Filimonas lacunae]|uniref:Uncharacterized conserved protein YdeI, YjbR/CyaY-like superfamily, DUF1801 family n=1 Tax=Filimonas lacunae TaxID=477680 RepID=A0A173MGB5_9BACT|nr:YdeI/OmpD-associated family protein [Filimonas lacunae]BAV06471.1 hypothetical protein FLA_2490 [Filimonas lacunae]SIT27083.1 Uncharacterized conserved protein YdeI, YjbR/CyaY-like superfamily, DUF1801 family [Filimonas lacunae]